MRKSSITTLLAVVCGTSVLLASGFALGAQFFGDNVGIVCGKVEKGDDEKGLTIRSTPSSIGAPMGWLPIGTIVRGSATFTNGCVKIEVPVKGGWVPMNLLTPQGGEAVVAKIDTPDMCLRIRSGPSASYEKVGCAEMGQKMELTGLWSTNGWAQVSQPTAGWVTGSQIESAIKPLGGTASAGVGKRSSSSDEEIWPEPQEESTVYVGRRRLLRRLHRIIE